MKRILVFGDSNTWGYDPNTAHPVSGAFERYPKNVRWTGVLQTLLGDEYEIIEQGLNGRTIAFDDPLEYGRNGLAALPIIYKTVSPVDMVVIMLGTNDLKDMFAAEGVILGAAMDRMVKELKTLIADSVSPDAGIMIVNPANVRTCGDGKFVYGFSQLSVKHGSELKEQYANVARQRNCEFFDADALPGITLDPIDGVHLTPSDHNILAHAMAEKIREVLG